MVVGLFAGPRELCCYPDLSLGTDEDVFGAHVSDFQVFGVEGAAGEDHRIDEIPKFGLFEIFALHAAPVHDFVAEEVGVVLKLDLNGGVGTVAIPPLPQN